VLTPSWGARNSLKLRVKVDILSIWHREQLGDGIGINILGRRGFLLFFSHMTPCGSLDRWLLVTARPGFPGMSSVLRPVVQGVSSFRSTADVSALMGPALSNY
jgi:hypothetical protein